MHYLTSFEVLNLMSLKSQVPYFSIYPLLIPVKLLGVKFWCLCCGSF